MSNEVQNVTDATYPKMYLYKRVVQAKLFIDQNYGESIDLDNIADEAYFSKFHFIRLFKKIYNRTPHQYLQLVRIEEASKLLKTNSTVAEACHAVGFESLSSFSGLFKKIMGHSPTAYSALQGQIRNRIKEVPLQFVPGCFAGEKVLEEKQF